VPEDNEHGDVNVVKLRPVRLPYINMQTWDNVPTPEQDWIVRDRLPRRQCALFSGEGAIGKSMTMLYLSAACTLGRDWLGTMPEIGPALFIDAEDEEPVIHRRLAAIVRHYDVRFTDLINGGLNLVTLAGQDAVLAAATRSGKIEPTPNYNLLYQACSDIKPVVIGLASSANFFAGNEINRSEVQQFVAMLTKLAIVANGCLVLLSHPSLTGMATGSGLSGNTQWHNSVRARFFMRNVKTETDSDDEADEHDIREIVFKKNNYGPKSETIRLEWRDGMFLPKRTASPMDQAAVAARSDEVLIKLLKRFDGEVRFVSPRRGPNYAPAVFTATPEARESKLSGKMFEAAMERLFAAGTIANEQYGRPSRPNFRIAIRL
jgi:RecA-family ATPase